jgi:hypothetical protein
MADRGFGKTRGAYLFAKICSILVKAGPAMIVLMIDEDEELVGDKGGDG